MQICKCEFIYVLSLKSRRGSQKDCTLWNDARRWILPANHAIIYVKQVTEQRKCFRGKLRSEQNYNKSNHKWNIENTILIASLDISDFISALNLSVPLLWTCIFAYAFLYKLFWMMIQIRKCTLFVLRIALTA